MQKLLLLVSGILLSPLAAHAVSDREYVGINNGVGYNTDPTYVARCLVANADLGVGAVRMGMDGVNGRKEGDAFDFKNRDRAVKMLREAKIEIRCPISARGHVERDADPAKWKANWRYFVQNVFRQYRGQIFYYIIDNEPDIDYGNGKMSAQECFDMTQIAFQEAKKVDAKILIQSPPTSSPENGLLREMLALDIGKVCDVIGVHAYGGQIAEERFGQPWKWISELKATRRPLAISESGAIDSYGKFGPQSRREWFEKYYQQAKRWGYSHIMLFDLEGHGEWSLVREPFDKTPEIKATPSYTAIKEGYNQAPIGGFNGGFEARNDPRYEWFPYSDSEEPTRLHFANFAASGAFAGRNCLEIRTPAKTTQFVRRVVGPLVVGKSYTLEAMARNGSDTQTFLSADGTQKLEGDKSFRAEAKGGQNWQKLETRFTPSNPWVVVTLGTIGGEKDGRAFFDEVKLR